MHTERSNPNTRASLFRLAVVGLFSVAATLSTYAQTANTPAATTDQTKTTTTQTVVTTTTAIPSTEAPIVLNEFTVNGSFAGSLEMAAQLKQSSDAIVEVIAPEDIGKLPDVSIADDLVRLTGLTSERVNGRNQEITIRGLDPDFNVGTLDGVEQATTGDNRDVQYDQYPSALVGGVTVYKTGQADLVGGIGGTIDMQTVSPLSFDHRVFALDAYYNWTHLGELTPGQKVTGYSYSASYIDQFLNGTEGLYVGFAHRENPYEGQQFQSWGDATAPDGNLIMGGMKIYDQNDLLKSNSGVIVIESKPNDNIHSKIDLFLSCTNENQLLRGMEVPMAEWGPATLQPGYTVTNGLITNYTITHVNPVVRSMDTGWLSHLASGIWNLDLAEKSDWPVHFQMGWSSAKQSNEVLETYAGLYFANSEPSNLGATFAVSNPAGPTPPTVVSSTTFSDPSVIFLTDPDGYGTGVFPVSGMEGYLKYFKEDDVADSFKLTTTHQLDNPVFKDVIIGLSYNERFKQYGQNPSGYLINSDGQPTAPLPAVEGTTNLSFIGNLHPVAFDPNFAYDSGLINFVPNPNPGNFWGDNYKVWEKVARPFIKFDMKGDAWGVPFEGNVGMMVSYADQNSFGYSGNGSNIVFPVTGGASYFDFLPSLNLIFKPTPKDLIRFSLGRQEMRPTMYQMRASRSFGYNATDALSTTISPWSATSGNPSIRPWLADSVDLSLEHYFAHGGGYVSLALFEKQLETYIYQQQTVESFVGYPYTGATPPVINYGLGSQYVNGSGGNMSGVEANVQLGSEVFTGGTIKGFGIQLNGAIIDSSIKPWGPNNASAPLPDLSKKTANITLYYERYGFSARVQEHYQGATREYIVQFGAPTFSSLGTPNDGYSIEIPYHEIDAQIQYGFKSGLLKGLTLYIEGRNLNNAPLITYTNNDPRQLANWQKYGASYRSGVSYKF
jgi:iron complex outermembrane receptor protein